MPERTFTKLADQSADIQQRCKAFMTRKDAQAKGWTAEIVWEKAQGAAELLYLKGDEDGLEFLEATADLPRLAR